MPDHNSPATGAAPCLYVPPAISYHKAFRQRYAVTFGRPQKHSRLGFAAIAVVHIVVLTDFRGIEPQTLLQMTIDCVNGFARLGSASNIRLVGHHDQAESVTPQHGERSGDVGWNNDFRDRHRRKGLAVADQRIIEDTVPIKKDRLHHLLEVQRTPSHLVCRAFKAG